MSSFDDEFTIRKRKKSKKDKPEGLKLILKVGNSATSTPEHAASEVIAPSAGDISSNSCSTPPAQPAGVHQIFDSVMSSKSHKKSKKKKKKKEKDKDHEKRERKKKHRKDKKKKYKDEEEDRLRRLNRLVVPMEDSCSVDETILSVASGVTPSDDMRIKLGKGDSGSEIGSRRCSIDKEKNSLQKLLEWVHQNLEKKDTQRFFAWPVTDQIAPGYSQVIQHPMDLSTMRRKIESDAYRSLTEYLNDAELMCRNAMAYNRAETIYYKAAKKLQHAASKLGNRERLDALRRAAALPGADELTAEQLGFEWPSEDVDMDQGMDTAVTSTPLPLKPIADPETEQNENVEGIKQSSVDDTATSEDILAAEMLALAEKAAKEAAEKIMKKKTPTEMGFLRQREDGSTSLAIVVGNDGVDTERAERPVLLGSLVGKLSHGTGTLHSFREDKRNLLKPVKPLYYGAFGSYAPSYDSTFANLTKEESELLFETYGDETAVQYAESMLNFSRECDYVTTMVDNLLDIMTGGEHRKTKKIVEETKRVKEDEERMRMILEKNANGGENAMAVAPNNVAADENITENDATSTVPMETDEKQEVDVKNLKSLAELGIDTTFLEYFDGSNKECELKEEVPVAVSEKLEHTRSLIEKLQQTQHERLSAPLPPHLGQLGPPSDIEQQLAEKVTENLANIIKKAPPGMVAPVAGVRKAMGVAPLPSSPQHVQPLSSSNSFHMQHPAAYVTPHFIQQQPTTMNEMYTSSDNGNPTAFGVTNATGISSAFDLESELREILESDPGLSSFHLADDEADKTIEQMLSAHSTA